MAEVKEECRCMMGDGSLVRVRTYVMFVLLYITGLRAGNLAFVTVRHVRELLSDGTTELKIIKKRPGRHKLVLSPSHRHLLKECASKMLVIFKGKSLKDFAFTPESRPKGKCSKYVYKYVLNDNCHF